MRRTASRPGRQQLTPDEQRAGVYGRHLRVPPPARDSAMVRAGACTAVKKETNLAAVTTLAGGW